MKRNPEQGAIAVLMCFFLPVIFALACLAIDWEHRHVMKLELQTGIEQSARAGAGALDGTASGPAKATTRATAMAAVNSIDISGSIKVSPSDIDVGFWDMVTRKFYPIGTQVVVGGSVINVSTWAPQYLNATRVKMATDGVGGHNPPTPLSFPVGAGPIVIRAGATAVAGGTCSNGGCTLPLVIPSCSITDGANGQTMCGTTQTLYFDHQDGRDIVLANILDPNGNVNNNTLRQQAAGGVSCTNSETHVGDQVQLGNGTDFNVQIASALRPAVCNAAAPYDTCQHYQLAVSNNGNCAAPMNQAAAVVGFVQVVITGLNPSGTDASISVYIDCGGRSKDPGGCANFGFGNGAARTMQIQ